MPTAPIRSITPGSRADRSGFANHNAQSRIENTIFRRNQRLQISARTTTAISNNPTNRIMMVPIFGDVVRNGIGSVLSGRMLCMKSPRKIRAPRWRLPLVATRARFVQIRAKVFSVLIESTKRRASPWGRRRRSGPKMPDGPLDPSATKPVSYCEGRQPRASTA